MKRIVVVPNQDEVVLEVGSEGICISQVSGGEDNSIWVAWVNVDSLIAEIVKQKELFAGAEKE